MNAWQELVKMALLGTEKMSLQTAVLPQNIQNILEKADKTDQEAYFLKAAALTLTYWKAGRLPDKTPLPEIAVAPDETLNFAPPQYINVLKQLMDLGTQKYPDLYLLLFEKMKQNSFVVPHENVCAVLNLMEAPILKNHKTLISKVVGERGRWLQQFNDKWQLPKETDFDTVWAEGSSGERRMALEDLRKKEPKKAFELIKNAWETANARERRDFLKILSDADQGEEGAFVQTVYNDLMAVSTLTKAINNEMKEITARILLRNPTSDLFKSVVKRLNKYVSVKKTLLGLSSKTIFDIPIEEDDFLNKEVMKTEFAHIQTPSTNEYLTEYWFGWFLQVLHPTAWEILLKTEDWQTIFDVLTETDKKITGGRKQQQRDSFVRYVSMSFGNSHFRKGVLTFIKKYPVSNSNQFILNILSNDELESFFINKVKISAANNLKTFLLRDNWQWSSALSLHVLRGLIEDAQQVYYNAQFALNAAIHFDDCVLKELYQRAKQEETDWHKQHVRNSLVLPLIQFLELRKEIENLI